MRARFSTDRPVNATPSLAVRRIIPYPRSSAIRGDARHRATLDGAVRRIALTLCDLRVLAEESPIEEAGRLVERVRCRLVQRTDHAACEQKRRAVRAIRRRMMSIRRQDRR